MKLILRLSNRHFLQIQGQNNVFRHGQGVQQVVLLKDETQTVPAEGRQLALFHFRNIPALQQNTAGAGAVNGGDDIQKGTFAGAGSTHNGGKFALSHRKAHAVQCLGYSISTAKIFGYIFDFK